MPSRPQYRKTGELTYVAVGKRGQHKIVAKTVQPKPPVVPTAILPPPTIVINEPVVEDTTATTVDGISVEATDFEPFEKAKRRGKV